MLRPLPRLPSVLSLIAVIGGCQVSPSNTSSTESSNGSEATGATATGTGGSDSEPSTDTGGTDSGTATETGTETGGPSCDIPAHQACKALASQASGECWGGCAALDPLSCEVETCQRGCIAANNANYAACIEQHCPPEADDAYEEDLATFQCYEACDEALLECVGDNACVGLDCEVASLACDDDCYYCWRNVPPHFVAYAGSCTIELPEPLRAARADYVTVRTLDQSAEFAISQDLPLDMCGDPPNVGAIWTDDSIQAIELCPDLCAQYELDGALWLVFGPLPCD